MNRRGYTLVEMVFVLLIFVIVIGISTSAFQKLVNKGSQQGKSAEGNILGNVGLEMMRNDVSHAGYGLPWAFPTGITPTYTEVNADAAILAGTGVAPASFNDSTTTSNIPRAIMSKTSATSLVDYLVIKGTILGTSPAAKRWNFVTYSGSTANWSYLKSRTSDADPNADTNLHNADVVTTVVSSFTSSGAESRTLMAVSTNNWSYAVPGNPVTSIVMPTAVAYQPGDFTDMVVAYGVNTAALGMPYNRVDYYVDKNAAKPVSCAPGTGVLYKAVANHAGGFLKYPLLDCVGDMQVVFYRDQNNDGSLMPIDDTIIAGMTDDDIRTQIKESQVFILTHEGKKDKNFTYPDPPSPFMNGSANNVICVAPPVGTTGCTDTVGRMWNKTTSGSKSMQVAFGTDWRNYRWKVYYFTVTLKNLQ